MFGSNARRVGRRAGRLQASAAESGNSWKRSAGLPYYLNLWSGSVAVIDAFKRLVKQRSPVYGAASRFFAGLASALQAASSAGPGQRSSSAVRADVRIAGARNSSQIMVTLPYGRCPDNCARAISSSLLGCLSSRTAPRRRVARAVENICRGHRSSLLTELWKPRSLTERCAATPPLSRR